MNKIIITLVFILGINGIICAQQSLENTLYLEEGVKSPNSDLSILSWLAGHWQGEAFGGITEEVWTSPLAGSMMGSFKLAVDGKISFYELMTISEEENSLLLRIKHFHQDLKGWEEKEESIDFKLVKVTQDKVYFEGLSFEKINENEINIYVLIDEGKQKEEVKFQYTRVANSVIDK